MRTVVLVCALVLAADACGGTGGSHRRDFRISPAKQHDPDVVVDIQSAIASHVDEDGGNEAELLKAASPGERAVYALAMVDDEVNNGGFDQFFTNSSGALMRQAIAGASLVHARKHERLLRAAARKFPHARVPVDVDERNRALEKLDASTVDAFGGLDERWYELERELDRRLRTYIDAHPTQFFEPT